MESLTKQKAELDAANSAAAKDAGIELEANASVDALVQQFRSLPPGGRQPVLRAIIPTLRMAAWKSRDLSHLDFFRNLLADETATSHERRWALIVAHTLGVGKINGLLDYYTPYLHDSDPAVRLYAVEGLVWIRGDEGPLAHARFREALDDPDYKIRSVVASFLSMFLKDPADADLLEEHLVLESNSEVAGAMMNGIKRLDHEGYTDRLRDVLPRVHDEIRPLIESRLVP